VDENAERRNVVASGKTVDEAIANGLTMLGVLRNEVDVEVITEGSRGVLGFGAENAQVKLLVKAPAAPVPPPLPVPAPAVLEDVAEPPLPAREQPKLEGEDQSAAQAASEILVDLLRLMDIRASVESSLGYELADEGESPPIVLNISGGDLGILIGRRGETLRALQYLVRLMVSHRLKHWTNLIVDVENYLVRRKRSLEGLALRVADEVARTGRAQALEPMTPYERRLVHIALRNHKEVATQSVGEGERRKVTVFPQ
jgi:spoIIIJ-associated protein